MAKQTAETPDAGLFLKGKVLKRRRRTFEKGVKYVYSVLTTDRVLFLTEWTKEPQYATGDEVCVPVLVSVFATGKGQPTFELQILKDDGEDG